MSAAAAKREVPYSRPWMYPAQEKAIFTCTDVNGDPARYAIIEASTKAGKTVGCMAWLYEQAIIRSGKNRNFWWVAPVYPQAKIAYRRMKAGLRPGTFVANETELTIKLDGLGSTIWFKSGEKPDNLYGEDVYAAVIDEASRCREDSWIAVRSTLTATNGPARIIGNVKGRTNWHYRLARQAEAGTPGMSYAKLTAYDAVEGGVLTLSEIEDAKKMLAEHVFRELYLAEPSDDGGNPFGLRHIDACLIDEMSEDRPVAIGVDLAKSRDWTVVTALDRYGRVCGFERWQSPWEETENRIIALCGSVPTLVDSTGVGDPILERLQRRSNAGNFYGFKFSGPSKQRLMEGLATAIQSRSIRFPEGPIKNELDTFEYEHTRTGVRYSAPEGLHDDCVCSLALAWQQYTNGVVDMVNVLPDGLERISPWFGDQGEDGEFYG